MRLDTRHAFHLAFLLVVLGVCAPDLLAQQPAESGGALVGVVRDGLTERPVSNASVLVEGTDLRGFTDASGAFSVDGAPDGPHLLRISRFGYDDLVVPVRVGEDTERLEFYLQPRPLLLEGMEVTGRSESVLTGAVVDARTGEGLPWALLRLGDRRPQSADGRGSFRIDGASPGSHLLLVERLGYESVYVPVTVGADMEPLVVELEPDPIMLEGIEIMVSRFERRRNAYGFGPVRAFDEGRLRRSGATDVVQFLRNHGSVQFVPCERGSGSSDCIRTRAGAVQPRVFIDEMQVPCGLPMLATYAPEDVHLVEIYDGGEQIRVYTSAYMERTGRRPQTLIPADRVPPPIGSC